MANEQVHQNTPTFAWPNGAKAAVSIAVEGETVNYQSLSPNYLGDMKVPDDVKDSIGDWLKTVAYGKLRKKN